jgi:hypothetical protein
LLTDFGTADERYVRKQVPLDDKDILIDAMVKNGHRDVPIVEAQIADLQNKRLEAGRAVLAQQFMGGGNSSSGSSAAEWYEWQQRLLAGTTGNFPLRGAVGYRPEITFMPQGTFMMARAVISGDRRYVRVSPAPMFMDILAFWWWWTGWWWRWWRIRRRRWIRWRWWWWVLT